jgi:hypothetical protein
MHHKGWAQWIKEVVLKVMACNLYPNEKTRRRKKEC